jgi:transposase
MDKTCARRWEKGSTETTPSARGQPRLSQAQKSKIPALLEKGAEAYGFRGDVWTRKRVAAVIRREFSVTYSARHVGRILRALGLSEQKPVKRAVQRDEEAIQQWVEETWPAIKKGSRGEPHFGVGRLC